MLEKLTKLIEVKKIIALMITTTLVSLSFKGSVSSSEFLQLATLVIGFYFGQSTAKSSK